ncbi:MAG: HD domain-containing protein [Firmicutes bacterium]|nr:HD domain-containing protein [Bacillota bacterium]
MKIVKTSELVPGMELTEDVYLSGKVLLLSKGTSLTYENIRWLTSLGVEQVTVKVEVEAEDSGAIDIAVEPVIHPFIQTYQKAVDSAERVLLGLVHNNKLDEYELVSTVKNLLMVVLNEPGVLKYLTWTREQNEGIFSHLVGVSAYSILLGRWLGYDNTKLMTVGLAGILHDLGKCLIPSEILDKPSTLTSDEFKLVQEHTTRGFHLAMQGNIHRIEILSAILQHHERLDGSGYPGGIKGNQIEELSKLIMITDIFDAMTSSRSYRQSRTVFDAVEEIMSESYVEKLDPALSLTFVRRIVDHFVGMKVELSSGAIGKVIQVDQQNPHRPVIWTEDQMVDLRDNMKISISRVLPD